jgi:hypothetical protein
MEKIIFILVFTLGMLFGNFIFYFAIEQRKGMPISTPLIKSVIGGVLFGIAYTILM